MSEIQKSQGGSAIPSEKQHFFLSGAGESEELAEPRECWEISRWRGGARDDYMLISIEPPLKRPHGIGYEDIYKVIVATRFKGRTLYPITGWPCDVFVMTHADSLGPSETEIRPEKIRIVAWAMLFPTLEEAEAHFNKFRRT